MAIYRPERKPKRWEKPDLTHPLCRGIVGWWMLNDNGSGTVFDISGQRNSGTLNGAAWTGNTLLFDGTDDYISFGTSACNLESQPCTISTWINTAETPTSPGNAIIARAGPNVGEKQYFIRLDTTRQVTFYLFTAAGGTGFVITTNTALAVGTWYHVCVSYDNSYGKIYINGKWEVSSALYTTGFPAATYTLYIATRTGVEDGYAHIFKGFIDDARIYNRAFSAAEIYQLYENALSGRYEEFPKLSTVFFYPAAGPVAVAPTAVFAGPLGGVFVGPI